MHNYDAYWMNQICFWKAENASNYVVDLSITISYLIFVNCLGKSTLACSVNRELYSRGKLSYVLDGDNLRHGLNKDLSFKAEDRTENIRRVGKYVYEEKNTSCWSLSYACVTLYCTNLCALWLKIIFFLLHLYMKMIFVCAHEGSQYVDWLKPPVPILDLWL